VINVIDIKGRFIGNTLNVDFDEKAPKTSTPSEYAAPSSYGNVTGY
jgi:hypothetical protein